MDNPVPSMHGWRMGVDGLRRMEWLGEARARGYLRLLAALNAVMLVFLLVTSRGGIDRNGFLVGSDFISFWTAGRMLGGQASVYDAAAHIAAQRAYFASLEGYTAFFYPPVFLPFCRPLGLMGYFPALGLWLLATGAFYFDVVRTWWRALPLQAPVWLVLLAFPAVPIVLTHGQTSFLVAGLLGLGVWLVPRRPVVAGVLLGLATIKPQLGFLVPLALLLTREWRAIGAAAIAAGVLGGLASMAFGPQIWLEWWVASGRAQDAMASGAVPFGKMVSVFAAMRLVGAPVLIAYAMHGFVSALVAGLVIRIAWKRRRFDAALGAVVLAGAPLVTPFVLDYDLVLLAFPMMWLTAQGLARGHGSGFRDWEKLAIACAFVAPAFARPLALNLHVPVMPLVLGLLLAAVVRRATETPDAHLQAEPAGA